MKLNNVDWKTTGINYLYEHPHKKQYLSRIPFTYEGKRKFHTEKHTKTDLRTVRRLHTQLMAEVQSGNYIPLQIKKTIESQKESDRYTITKDKTLAQCIDILEREANPSTKKQISTFKYHVAPLALYKKSMRDITYNDLLNLKKALDTKYLKDPTYTLIRSYITQAFNRAELFNQFQHFTTGNPFKSQESSSRPFMEFVQGISPHITALQVAKGIYNEIINIEDVDTKRVLLLTFLLSKRINEIKEIKFSDIDIINKTVKIAISKRKGKPKEEKQTYPLPDEIIPLLKDLKEDDYIASRRATSNRPYSPVAKTILSTVSNIEEKKLAQYGIHAFRSIALQTLIDEGYDEIKVDRVLLDHSSGKVISSYRTTTLTEKNIIYGDFWKLLRQ